MRAIVSGESLHSLTTYSSTEPHSSRIMASVAIMLSGLLCNCQCPLTKRIDGKETGIKELTLNSASSRHHLDLLQKPASPSTASQVWALHPSALRW